jgi:hypothetical protein
MFMIKKASAVQDGLVMDVNDCDRVGDGLVEDEGIVRDWRYVLQRCIEDPSSTTDRKVRRQALKYMVMGDELYR